MTTTVEGSAALMRGRTSIPASPGIRWSSITRSISCAFRTSSAWAPLPASRTSQVSSRIARTEARTPSSSSTTRTVPRRASARPRPSPLARAFHREVLIRAAAAAAGAMDVDQDRLAGLERGERLEERGRLVGRTARNFQDDVAAAETGLLSRAPGQYVGDEQAARDRQVQAKRGVAGEGLHVEAPLVVAGRLGHERLVGRHLANLHGDRHGLLVADHRELHRLPRADGRDAPLEVGHLLDGRAAEIDDDVARLQP